MPHHKTASYPRICESPIYFSLFQHVNSQRHVTWLEKVHSHVHIEALQPLSNINNITGGFRFIDNNNR